MSMPLTDSINALTVYANETTGKQDATLSDAVYTLASGYGGGDSGVKTDSGIAYIEADAMTISINHSLGDKADFAMIRMDYDDASSVPYGCCVTCVYNRLPYANMPNQTKDIIKFTFVYRHPTSGNFLAGEYQVSASKNTATSFSFDRGNQGWKAFDANGNPIPYKWVVGRFTT